MHKPKLNVIEQIEYMRDKKGIKFGIVSESEAEQFLKYNTYFFKVKSYAKNFEKYNAGENKDKYINLDFAYLIELSEIDMILRHLIIQITLDTEHFFKLYTYYYSTYKTPNPLDKHLWSVRQMRNAAAHNTCLLNSINKLNNLFNCRIPLNKDYFTKNQPLTSHYFFVRKIVDYFCKEYII